MFSISNHFVYMPMTILSIISCLADGTRVAISAPVNPIQEGGILSIRCQVWQLQKGVQVTIFKTASEGDGYASQPQMITVDNVITVNSDDVFLAERHMADGSTVYLLSVIRISRQEAAGVYVCKLRDIVGVITDLPSDSVHLEFSYFPDKSDPMCTATGDIQTSPAIPAGANLTLICSSAAGNPRVVLEWDKQNEINRNTHTFTRDGRVYTSLNFRVSNRDSGVMFICSVRSSAFPGRVQTCHYGPIVVEGANTNDRRPHDDDTTLPPMVNTIMVVSTLDKSHYASTKDDGIIKDCRRECSTASRYKYWVIITTSVGIIAFVLFIIVFWMALRYQRTRSTWSDYQMTHTGHTTTNRERLYAELQTKQRESVLYMSLSRAKTVSVSDQD